MPANAEACAREVMEVIPPIMRTIRAELRSQRSDLSIPQFRALLYLSRNPGASLGDITEHIGMTAPTMSKLMDGLVVRALVSRRHATADRRRITLELTPAGEQLLSAAHAASQQALARSFGELSELDCGRILQGLELLRRVFAAAGPQTRRTGNPDAHT